ncbi:MAG: class I SAM-dependent methyltransferase [Planctomycetota bacterium]
MATPAPCASCGSGETRAFYRQSRIPVQSCILVPSREEAMRFPCGELRLSFCRRCGFIQNDLFDAARLDYGRDYEETQGFSPRFREYARALAASLAERHRLAGKEVLEIGCGKGEFLRLLCATAGCRGVGYDPSYLPERGGEPLEGVRFVRELYTGDTRGHDPDLILCRHTLEHIPETLELLRSVRRTAGSREDQRVVFEVPDVLRILEECAFWDIYYEHCSYFSLGSLARLFRRAGFAVERLERVYGEQYLLVEARPAGGDGCSPLPGEEEPGALEEQVDRFEEESGAMIREWEERLREDRRRGRRLALWGSGSKAAGFLTTLGAGPEVLGVVDINPHKHGKFQAGTGHEILPPAALRQLEPDVILVMNPIYEDEIRIACAELGVAAELLAL